MGNFFSDTVESALNDIYYQMWTGRGQEAFHNLEAASAAGDGDASALLARCYCGDQYVWDGLHFPEDDDKATELLRLSVKQGSALGALICLRTGDMTPELESEMPFGSLQKAFNIVLAKAEAGEPFCQYVIGNSYFWWDFMRIQDKTPDDFPDHDSLREYLRENITKCEDWFWKAFKNGVFYGGNNLIRYYNNGDEDIVAPQPEKAADIDRIGAEYGYPNYQLDYALDFQREKKYEEALVWLNKAFENGEMRACYSLGLNYELGRGVEKNPSRAAEYYAMGLDNNSDSPLCRNRLGSLYYDGVGVQQDYEKAYKLLKWAYDDSKSTWGLYMLAECCAYGRGTEQDYAMARSYLDALDWESKYVNYLRGYLYACGLGGPEDIAKGVAYLQKAGDLPEAKEELKNYKKTFFGGKWVRRK